MSSILDGVQAGSQQQGSDGHSPGCPMNWDDVHFTNALSWLVYDQQAFDMLFRHGSHSSEYAVQKRTSLCSALVS